MDLQRSNDNLAVHGKIIIHLSTNVSTPLSNPGPSQTSGFAAALGNLASNASTVSLTPSQGGSTGGGAAAAAGTVAAAAATATPATAAASTDPARRRDLVGELLGGETAATTPTTGPGRNMATSAGASNPAPAAADRNFSATEDQYGPLPQGWERRTDHLGRTYYVCGVFWR